MITTKSPLVGQLLLAMPGMADPRFVRAVIFMCAHDDKGAMGLVLTEPQLGERLSGLMDQLDITHDRNGIGAAPVYSGGPVETGRGFILHRADFEQKDTVNVDDVFSVTATVDGLRALAGGNGPNPFLFFLGYAGWQAGQIEKELQDNAWLVAPATPQIIFDMLPSEKWRAAMNTIGLAPGKLSSIGGRA